MKLISICQDFSIRKISGSGQLQTAKIHERPCHSMVQNTFVWNYHLYFYENEWKMAVTAMGLHNVQHVGELLTSCLSSNQ